MAIMNVADRDLLISIMALLSIFVVFADLDQFQLPRSTTVLKDIS